MVTNCLETLTSKLMKLTTSRENIIFACIGTDRSTGDSLGPLVGTKLEKFGYNVIGTIDNPLHAKNLSERLRKVPEGSTVIAIDAKLGLLSSIGKIDIKDGPIKPGATVGKDLPEVGDISISGVVNVGGYMEFFVLQNTRLSVVMNMADQIVDVITIALSLQIKNESINTEPKQNLWSNTLTALKRLVKVGGTI